MAGKRILDKRTWIGADLEETTDPAEGVILLGSAGREITERDVESARGFVARKLKKQPLSDESEPEPVEQPDDASDDTDDGDDAEDDTEE